jgi:hypothetical protein
VELQTLRQGKRMKALHSPCQRTFRRVHTAFQYWVHPHHDLTLMAAKLQMSSNSLHPYHRGNMKCPPWVVWRQQPISKQGWCGQHLTPTAHSLQQSIGEH